MGRVGGSLLRRGRYLSGLHTPDQAPTSPPIRTCWPWHLRSQYMCALHASSYASLAARACTCGERQKSGGQPIRPWLKRQMRRRGAGCAGACGAGRRRCGEVFGRWGAAQSTHMRHRMPQPARLMTLRDLFNAWAPDPPPHTHTLKALS